MIRYYGVFVYSSLPYIYYTDIDTEYTKGPLPVSVSKFLLLKSNLRLNWDNVALLAVF